MNDRLRVFQYDGLDTNCGLCNWMTHRHYVVAATQEEADEVIEMNNPEDVDGRGFCASCLVDEFIIGDDVALVEVGG